MYTSFALKAWTGPTLARDIAQRLTDAGVCVSVVGTEHVYVVEDGSDAAAAAHNVCAALMRTHGTDLGLKFRSINKR